jgi:hypothetical protein
LQITFPFYGNVAVRERVFIEIDQFHGNQPQINGGIVFISVLGYPVCFRGTFVR